MATPRRARAGGSSRSAMRLSAPRGSPAASARAAEATRESMPGRIYGAKVSSSTTVTSGTSHGMPLRPSVEWLLVLLPVVVVLDRTSAAAPLVFFVAALVIVPLAALIVRSTEQVAVYTGPAVGGLLNATFGNLPELIIAVVALRAGLVEMVRASLIGAVLANGCWRSAWRSCWAAGDSTSWTTTRPGREHTPAC